VVFNQRRPCERFDETHIPIEVGEHMGNLASLLKWQEKKVKAGIKGGFPLNAF
jgi:hypothetical protein